MVYYENKDRKEKSVEKNQKKRLTAIAIFIWLWLLFSISGKEDKMERWVLLRKGADFDKISQTFGISRRLASLIRNREVQKEEEIDKYLNGTLNDLYDGMLMKDMDKAVNILKEKIEGNCKIRVIGDYDIDGVNATYILLEGLRRLGAVVDSDIPDRLADGYGLSEELIRRAYDARVDTILTCDNGIAAGEEVAYARHLGMTVIVTDHHEIPYQEEGKERFEVLPCADAVVDPKRADCDYPFSGLCGASVAYKLMECLHESMGYESEDLDDLIENVAIATVGDVVDLVDENRILVKEGLAMLRRTSNPGLQALIECTGIDKKQINSYHIGFVLGPCMNASGRLDTAKRALQLLCTRDKKEAAMLAGDLKGLNDSRKDMTVKAVEKAISQVEESKAEQEKVLVLYLPDCHESLAGIVAGRIREKYYRPVFVITDGKEGLKGSGRSIETYHMYEALHECQDLLTRYGGHRMAAGLSLEKENLEILRKRLNENCQLSEEELIEKVVIDMELPFSCVTEEFLEELSFLEPFGKGNTKPVFAGRNIEVLSGKILGKNKNVLKLRVRDEKGTVIDAVYFGGLESFSEKVCVRYGEHAMEEILSGKGKSRTFSFTYYPDINEYMGKKSPQIVITHCQ